MLVEDHAETAAAVSRLLRSWGHAVHTAGRYDDALRAFADNDAELVLLDIGLPDGDGCDLLHEMLNIRDAKVVAMTGHAFPQERSDIHSAGFDDYLFKPFTSHQLGEVVQGITKMIGARHAPISD